MHSMRNFAPPPQTGPRSAPDGLMVSQEYRELILDPLELIIAVQKQTLRGSQSDLIEMIRVVSQTF